MSVSRPSINLFVLRQIPSLNPFSNLLISNIFISIESEFRSFSVLHSFSFLPCYIFAVLVWNMLTNSAVNCDKPHSALNWIEMNWRNKKNTYHFAAEKLLKINKRIINYSFINMLLIFVLVVIQAYFYNLITNRINFR